MFEVPVNSARSPEGPPSGPGDRALTATDGVSVGLGDETQLDNAEFAEEFEGGSPGPSELEEDVDDDVLDELVADFLAAQDPGDVVSNIKNANEDASDTVAAVGEGPGQIQSEDDGTWIIDDDSDEVIEVYTEIPMRAESAAAYKLKLRTLGERARTLDRAEVIEYMKQIEAGVFAEALLGIIDAEEHHDYQTILEIVDSIILPKWEKLLTDRKAEELSVPKEKLTQDVLDEITDDAEADLTSMFDLVLPHHDPGTGEERPPKFQKADLEILAQEGKSAFTSMQEHNLRLAFKYAMQARVKPGVPRGYAIARAEDGLYKAIQKFDYTKGYTFSTYAKWWIMRGLQQGEMLEDFQAIRWSQGVHQALSAVRTATFELKAELPEGTAPTDELIEQRAGLRVGQLAVLRQVVDSQTPIRLDRIVGGDSDNHDTAIGELTILEPDPTADTAINNVERDTRLTSSLKALARLDERLQRIMLLRFGLVDNYGLSAAEIEGMASNARVTAEKLRQQVRNGQPIKFAKDGTIFGISGIPTALTHCR